MSTADIRPVREDDRAWINEWIAEAWGDETVVSRGKLRRPADLPGLVAERNGQPVGLLTYAIDGDSCEIVTLDSKVEHQGIGTALIRAVIAMALENGIWRLWLITTNDNTPALRFYEHREFRVVAVHKDAMAESRRLKPAIPLTGIDGVEIRDEIELEIFLAPGL